LAGDIYFACATPTGSRSVRWKRLGNIGVMEARKRRDAFATEVRRGGTVAPSPARVTFAAVATEWLDDQRTRLTLGDLAPKTFSFYESGLRLHCLPMFGKRRLSSITPDDLVAWHRAKRSAGYADDSIRAMWTPLRLVLSQAVRTHVIDSNPA